MDGMGPCGTEGMFVRAAEETTRILRKNADALLTILSAVVADPLYKWTVNPLEARRRQKLDDEEVETENVVEGNINPDFATETVTVEDQNKQAVKTLAHINSKLQGYEDSTSGEQQGIEGQVQLLINSARDPDNLCALFPGWAPWM